MTTGSTILEKKDQVKRFLFVCGALVPWIIALVVKLQRSKNIQILHSNKPDLLQEELSSSLSPADTSTTPVDEQTSKTQQQHLLVLHIGPGKTGTTGLQVDLTKPEFLQESLRHDGYWYAGRYYNHTHIRPNDGHFYQGRESFSPLLEVLREILIPREALNGPLQYCSSNNSSTPKNCWDVFRNELDQASKTYNSTNILLSDEPLAVRWSKEQFATLKHSLSPNTSAVDKDVLSVQLQQEQQPQLHYWKPLIVVSYRRFYEWLPSSIYQRNRKRFRDTAWPTKEDLHAFELLWPNMVTQWRENHYTFMDSLVDQAQQARLDYRILNIHRLADNNNHAGGGGGFERIRTQFLCHVLPNAPSSCATSRQMDDKHVLGMASSSSAERESNSSQSSSSNPKTHKRVNARDQELIELMNQDMITTQAAAQGLIQQSVYTRTQVREALREHLLANSQSTTADLEQYCPTRDELDILLQQSLDMEAAYILPTLSNNRTRQQWVDEHRQGFDQMVASNAFCILNMEAAIHQLWSFFEQFSN